MDDLTAEQYTSPWWTEHPTTGDGPTALTANLPATVHDDDLTTALRRRELRAELDRFDSYAQPGDNPVDKAASGG